MYIMYNKIQSMNNYLYNDFYFIFSLQPVKGLYVWCQGCGHGGHLQHLKDWFDGNSLCPTAGCGHICTLSS